MSIHAESGSLQKLPDREDRDAFIGTEPQQMLVAADDEICLTRDGALQNAIVVLVAGYGSETEVWIGYFGNSLNLLDEQRCICRIEMEFITKRLT